MIRGLSVQNVRRLIENYSYGKPDPTVERRSDFLPYEAFVEIAEWKTLRQKSRYMLNRGFVEDVTGLAFRQADDRRKISLLCTMDGVLEPVASAVLHFGHNASYPILDRRALWTLRGLPPHRCNLRIWADYVRECREQAQSYGVSVRDLDKALWQYSVQEQGGSDE